MFSIRLAARCFRFASTVMLFAVSAVLPVVAYADPCPPDSILGYESLGPAWSKTRITSGIVKETGAYDLVAGALSGRFETVIGDAIVLLVIAEDEYVLSGPPAGTPIALGLELSGSGTRLGSGGLGFSAERLGGALTQVASAAEVWADSTELALAEQAEVPFHVRYHVWAWAGAIGVYTVDKGSATFRFTDLPAGVTVHSCQGYQQASVPARETSWGLVKAHYR